MLIRPTQPHTKDTFSLKSTQSTSQSKQHGQLHLLDFPAESLAHITSFLEPPSLLNLSRVNKALYDHVKDDNTWRRAFHCQLLGIAPESNLSNISTLLLRRTETTWKNELIARYKLRKRWECSHNTTVTHNPHDSSIAGIHLMPAYTLLASSLQYGIVSRSHALTGKVLRGFIDASGTGLGIGNPNREFTPNISACALASDGGTALILWGFRSGEIAIVTANRAMEGRGRAAVTAYGCRIEDKHNGAVLDAVWGKDVGGKGIKGASAVLTGAADGRVKIWDSRSIKCLWASNVAANVLIPDPCVKVTAALENGIVVGAMSSGEVVVWSGLDAFLPYGPPNSGIKPPVNEIRVPCPIHIPEEGSSDTPKYTPTALYIDDAQSVLSILVAYENHPHFYRLQVDLLSCAVIACPFGNSAFAPISAILPCFTRAPDESSFIVTGNHLGYVGIYDWSAATPTSGVVAAVRTLEAHVDGAGVSALAWNGKALVTGSSCGSVRLWDTLTLELMLEIVAPGPGPRVRARAREGEGPAVRGVSQILLVPESNVLVAAVGSRVMAWRAGTAEPWKGKGKGVIGRGVVARTRRGERAGVPKYHQQKELHESIFQSQLEIEEERVHAQHLYGREMEQRARLEMLGLDEVEAVEYMLMISRDEEEMRLATMAPLPPSRDGVFVVDFDEAQLAMVPQVAQSTSRSRPSSSGSQSHQQSMPRTVVTASNCKVQVSPRFKAEPMETGVPSSPLSLGNPLRTDDEAHFPAMGVSMHCKSSSPSLSVATSTSSTPVTRGGLRSASGSPESGKSAWNTRLTVAAVNSSGTAAHRSVGRDPVQDPRSSSGPGSGSGLSLLGADLACHTTRADVNPIANMNSDQWGFDKDGRKTFHEELRLAIELSLVEARSLFDD